jgi:hypothetical protein
MSKHFGLLLKLLDDCLFTAGNIMSEDISS